MTLEPILLNLFFLLSAILAPIMTNPFFLNHSSSYKKAHIFTVIIIVLSFIFHFKFGYISWPIFCLYGVYLRIKGFYSNTPKKDFLVSLIPFVFSLIGATWFIAAVFDLYLLGYDQAWSSVALMHSNFLGWLLTGCIAYLSTKATRGRSQVYRLSSYLLLISFIFIALGIYLDLFIKSIGIFILILAALVSFTLHAYDLRKDRNISSSLSIASLSTLIVTLGLAIINEYAFSLPELHRNFLFMIRGHGLINALIVIPSFYYSIRLNRKQRF